MSKQERGVFISKVGLQTGDYLPLQEEVIYQATLDFVQGRVIDWHSPEAPRITKSQFTDVRSRTSRLIIGLVTSEESEAQKSLDVMRQDLERLDPDLEMLRSSIAQEFLLKLALGMVIHTTIKGRTETFGSSITTKEQHQFQKMVEERVDKFASLYKKFKPEDLDTFITLEDIMYRSPQYQGPEMSRVPKGRDPLFEALPLNTNLQQLSDMAIENDMSFINKIRQARRGAWERLKKGWGWREIQTIARLLPQIQHQEALDNTLTALETNLLTFDHPATESLNFNAKEILFLLGKKWGANNFKIFNQYYPKPFSPPHDKIDIRGNQVPREHTPSAAISLLQKISQATDYEGYRQFLIQVSQEIATKKDLNLLDAWTVTLMSIPGIEPSDLANLLGLSGLSQHLKETLLDQRPGKIRLLKNGKLQLREASARINEGFLIYTSAALPPEPPAAVESLPQPVQEKPKVIDLKQKAAQETITIPHFGPLALIRQEDTNAVLEENALKNGVILDTDELLLKLIELHEKFDPTSQRKLIYVSKLNPHDEELREAKHLGIQAVVADGRDFTFIFDTDTAYSQSAQERIPAAFRATLDQSGDLKLPDMDSNLQLLFNTLTLSLITRDFPTSQEELESLNGDLSKVVRTWNEKPKNFRIGPSSLAGVVPIEVKGHTILHTVA